MYDDYPSTPSTSSSSRLKPVPHLAFHPSPLSSTHTHPMSYGQRASKASDIAHLLDPSYSPSRANYLNQVYVDHAGDAHDPDFRLFAPAGYSPKRREFLTCDSDDDADADADDLDDLSIYDPRRASFESARSASYPYSTTRPTSRASDPIYSHTAHDSSYAAFTYTFEEQGYLSEDEPRREVNKLRRRRTSFEQEFPVEEQQPVEPQSRVACTSSPSTTRSHMFRRQWHALRLRTQVAAFRARKRVTRIVSPSAG